MYQGSLCLIFCDQRTLLKEVRVRAPLSLVSRGVPEGRCRCTGVFNTHHTPTCWKRNAQLEGRLRGFRQPSSQRAAHGRADGPAEAAGGRRRDGEEAPREGG